jgi:hypothetical protein
MGITGALRGASAFPQKTPPAQLMFRDAKAECDALAERRYTDVTRAQAVRGGATAPVASGAAAVAGAAGQ